MSAVLFVLLTLLHVGLALGLRVPLPPGVPAAAVVTVATTLFSVLHAWTLLGPRRLGLFFGLSAVVSWIFEEIGVRTGLVFGAYHYTDLLGPKVLDVPLLIPLAWFAMTYPSYVIATCILEGRPSPDRRSSGLAGWRTLLAGCVMTAWDLVMDPRQARAGAWVWPHGGAWFGVPLHNFAGWMVTTTTVYLLYELGQRRIGTAPPRTMSTAAGLLPVLVYAVTALRYAIENDYGVMAVVAVFAMGVPCLFAVARVLTAQAGPAKDG